MNRTGRLAGRGAHGAADLLTHGLGIDRGAPLDDRIVDRELVDALTQTDLESLRLFCADYPEASGHLFYGGTVRYRFDAIEVVPIGEGLSTLGRTLR